MAEQRPADEQLTVRATLFACPFVLVWARAAARAAFRLCGAGSPPLAATVGLFRPAVVVSEAVRAALDAEALAAVHAHERAHARHRDPLRIWLAHLATDLQWPCRAARSRLDAWRRALEMARDEEVRAAGTDGLDLAAAVLGVARLTLEPRHLSAAFFDDDSSFRERIERLLSPAARHAGPASSRSRHVLLVVGLAVAVLLGVVFGDPVVAGLLHALA
jgi:beta-lactamase regulating signal transducer with metallopeptidase domain